MFKATLISTIFAASAFQASAGSDEIYDLSILPADVAARVIEMQEYGDRFDAAIRAVLAEAAKPSWSFDDCGHEAADVTVESPQS